MLLGERLGQHGFGEVGARQATTLDFDQGQVGLTNRQIRQVHASQLAPQ